MPRRRRRRRSWDLCHWGVPTDLDPFSEAFSVRFAAFAGATARVVQIENQRAGIAVPPIYCPINEISFWAWVGGDVEHFHPYGEGRGAELKKQLVLASILATQAVLAEDPRARFVQAEPIIQISPDDDKPEDAEGAERHTASQFEAWDMLTGRRDPELGGSEELLDVLGINDYWNNQWIHDGERTPPGHHQHRPLHLMLQDLWTRYGRSIPYHRDRGGGRSSLWMARLHCGGPAGQTTWCSRGRSLPLSRDGLPRLGR
jgi:hypothetical protein